MAEELMSRIGGKVSPEVADLVVDISETLKAHNFYAHEDELDYLYTIEEDLDATGTGQDMVNIVTTGARVVLRQMKVELDEETPLAMLKTILDVLISFQPGDDYLQIAAVVEMEQPAVESLADILAIRSQYEPEDFLPYLSTVSDDLIMEIRRLNDEYEQGQVRLAESNEILAKTQLYRTEAGALPVVDTVIENGVPPGTSMESIYDAYEDQLIDAGIESSVKSLVALSLFSGLGMEAVADEVGFFIEDLYPSLEDSQKATRVLRSELDRLKALDL